MLIVRGWLHSIATPVVPTHTPTSICCINAETTSPYS